MALLDHLISTAGFQYDSSQGIFFSKTDPWQYNLGYFTLYDSAAPLAGCIIQCEPIRFTYAGKNWNIELWKGQYGAFTGAEIGIYTGSFKLNAPIIDRGLNRLGPGGDTKCANAADWLQMSFVLKTKNGQVIFTRDSDNPQTMNTIEKHWWLTGFKLGARLPSDLINEIKIVFKDSQMLNAFKVALENLGYRSNEFTVDIASNSIKLIYSTPRSPQPAQWALNTYEAIYTNVRIYMSKVFGGVQYSVEEAGEFIKRYYRLPKKIVAKILKGLTFGFNEIAMFLKQSMNAGLDEIGEALIFANATQRQIGDALKFCGYRLKSIADFFIDKFNLEYKDLAKLLRNIGYSIDSLIDYFRDKGVGYIDLVGILRFANFAKSTIVNAIARIFNLAKYIVEAIF